MQSPDIQERVLRFASLQAAYRALARSVHPAELAPVREQSRAFLIQLQDVSAAAEAEGGSLEPQSFEPIDRSLDEQSQRTRAILAGMELSQLRATVPALASTHPKEVEGLVDVLLTGDLQDDKSLRTSEYLITMLSAEENGGRRVVVKDPSSVTPQLRIIAQRSARDVSDAALDAEQSLEVATAKILQDGDVGETRDRMRDLKQSLGSTLLHPRVLAAAVAYNVAMWNKVAAEIDSSRAMEQFAEELFERPVSAAPAARAKTAQDVIGSVPFEQLVEAFRARVRGERSGDPRAIALAEELPIDTLRAEDVEVFESDEQEESSWLRQAAVVLGGLLTQRAQLRPAADALALDLEGLASHGLDDLVERMTALSRKYFASSQYQEAFRLSDVKTHNLAGHAAARAERAGSEDERPAAAAQEATASWFSGLAVSPSAVLVAVAALLFAFASFGGRNGAPDAETQARAIERVSPFLVSAQRGTGDEAGSTIGLLSRAWDYLGTAERRTVAGEIGGHFETQGADRVTLMDVTHQIAAIYSGGELVVLVPKQP